MGALEYGVQDEGYWGTGLGQMPLDEYVGKWVLDSGCGGAGKKWRRRPYTYRRLFIFLAAPQS